MLFCLVFPTLFFVGVFCFVFDRILVYFCCFLCLFLHCFVDKFDSEIDCLMFRKKFVLCYGLHYVHDVFYSYDGLFSVFYVVFLSSRHYQLTKYFQLTKSQYHLENRILHYHPFGVVNYSDL